MKSPSSVEIHVAALIQPVLELLIYILYAFYFHHSYFVGKYCEISLVPLLLY